MKKFIITKDEATANRLIACGFQLVSKTSEMWTFINVGPKHFSFEEIDKSTYSYSNTLFL